MLSTESPSTNPTSRQQKPRNESSSHKRGGFPEADLSKPAIVNQTSSSSPEFSIREYVLSSRSKDIKANWPFSPKTLQLCLKHGVKDILPPFKPDTRRVNSSNFANSKENQRQTSMTSNSCRFDGRNGLIPTIRSSNSPPKLDTLPEAPAPTESAEQPTELLVSRKMAKPMVKKCRFSINYGAHSYQASSEDIVSNCTTTSEAMASKTCPVCKILSSPSNTTLNAHIDQCVSVESTTTWSLDSKSMKHKFKPRKTKLLVDIFTTALPCTDRRNGTTWAIGSRPNSNNEKWGRGSLAPSKITNEDGVYFDTKGTKLGALSAFKDESWSKGKENLPSTRPEKEDEGIEFKLLKRKKWHASKHKKIHKFVVRRKRNSLREDPTSQIDKVNNGYDQLEEGFKMNKHQMKSRKPCDSGCLRQWICSKRTGVAKKVISEEDHRKWLLTEDLLFQTNQPRLDNMKNKKSSSQRLTHRSENPILFPENIDSPETECPLHGDRVSNNGGLTKKGKPSIGNEFLMKPTCLNEDSCQAGVLKNTELSKSSKNMSSFSESLSKSGSRSPPVKKRSVHTNRQTDSKARKIDEKTGIESAGEVFQNQKESSAIKSSSESMCLANSMYPKCS